jgi:hypothetical protein
MTSEPLNPDGPLEPDLPDPEGPPQDPNEPPVDQPSTEG